MPPPNKSTAGPMPGTPRANPVLSALQAISLLALAAIYSPLSQLILAPVYGSIPSSVFHYELTSVIALLALTRTNLISRFMPASVRFYLPVLASSIPAIHFVLFKYSTKFGVVAGPLLTESLTYYPLLLLSAYSAAHLLLDANVDHYLHKSMGSTVLGLSAYGFFVLVRSKAVFLIYQLFALSSSITRVSLQLAVGALFAVLSPSKLCLLMIPAFIHTTRLNPHFVSPHATALTNSTLHASQWNLLDRAESNTGYVSVLENLDVGYRVLRCDHSLLGGEWLITDQRRRQGLTSSEPIYAVFEILEAVRLVKTPQSSKPDQEKNALVIGLGIGTAPKALIAHGIDTTIVELDPIVHAYATQYFDLPPNHTAVLEDAVAWVQQTSSGSEKHYDYIIHDVFTGGAEPLPLFTDHFLQNLRSLLTPDGVIAINYAGDLGDTSTKQILNTINLTFNRQCRIFRDSERSAETGEIDFLNMVIFCKNASEGKLKFRAPAEADFLGTVSRRHYLEPKKELELQFPTEQEMQEEDVQTLTMDNLKIFEKKQVESARRHWGVMRLVIPDFVWELW